ncbi:MAG TPA: hypothetical protein VGU20_23370 [Stellaceae bacterium]|nr:hypothetical protein [Stellaceae bacterium]
MQAFLVRPVMTGLLALIIMGFIGVPGGSRGGAAFSYQSGCHTVPPETHSPAAMGAMIRRGVHC